jgi:hypothetical protein
MARRPGSTAERQARDRVRDRFDLEVSAVAEFFGYADQIDRLNEKVAALEAQQADVVARLADEVGPTRAADTVGWPITRVRDALTNRPPSTTVSTNGAGDE